MIDEYSLGLGRVMQRREGNHMYREIREQFGKATSLEQYLRRALLADDTRVMSTESANAQSVTLELSHALRKALDETGPDDANRTLVEAAATSLNLAWSYAEKVALGTSPTDMRAYIVDFKTKADHAVAYLHAAIGGEEI